MIREHVALRYSEPHEYAPEWVCFDQLTLSYQMTQSKYSSMIVMRVEDVGNSKMASNDELCGSHDGGKKKGSDIGPVLSEMFARRHS